MSDNMLSPLSEANPTGPDLSFSSAFDQIAELRRFDDPTLDQGEWVRDIKTADWAAVASLCAELLSTQTKDLRLAGWMTEALSHTRGFAGMADGLQVCAGLCESFWDTLHPLPDDEVPADDRAERFEQRIGNLSWLLAQLIELAHSQPLIVGKADGQDFGRRVIALVRSRNTSDADADLEPNEAQIALALAQTPGDALLAGLDGIEATLQALERLQTVVDAHLGVHGPNFSAARDALTDTQHMLKRFARERGLLQSAAEVPAEESQAGASGTPEETTTGPSPMFSGDALATRAQALARLRQVAAYFRRTEPHSPVAYLADKAAKWGEVPLHEWLRSVLKDPASLSQIEELLGMQPPASNA